MSTRGIIHIRDDKFNILCTIYKHWDSYPSSLGNKLKEIIGNAKIINGMQGEEEIPSYFNGMGCLAAYVIGQLKETIGDVYLYPPGWKSYQIEYEYDISQNGNGVMLSLFKTGGMMSAFGAVYKSTQLYVGTFDDFDPDKIDTG